MNRRSFIQTLLAGCVAPLILPGGGRLWKATIVLPRYSARWDNATSSNFFVFDEKAFLWVPQPDSSQVHRLLQEDGFSA